jgi:amidase
VDAAQTRIAQTSPAINAMVTPCPERARDAASRAAPESLLAGLPIGIKDLTPVAGVRSTYGTLGLKDHVPDTSSPLVTRLETRGAIVMGKTNTSEMGAGGNTFNAVFGPTRNPHDTRLNAGGSSGGAAAGLATGEVWLSQGSDWGGSLRTPASLCDVVGLRPSPGVVGGPEGADTFTPFGTDGPMARNVADLALFLDALTGFDPVWPMSQPAPRQSYLAQCLEDPGPIRLAWSPDLGGLAPVTPEMTGTLTNALTRLQSPQVTVEETTPSLTGLDHAFRTFRGIGMWTSHQVTPKRLSQHFKQTLQDNIAQGGQLTIDDVAKANLTRTRLYHGLRKLFDTHDVLACPVTGIGALPVEIEYPTEIAGRPTQDYLDWLGFAFLATVTGLPALSLPAGYLPNGMPAGLQLIGPPRGDGRLLKIARRLEEALSLPQTPIDPKTTHI